MNSPTNFHLPILVFALLGLTGCVADHLEPECASILDCPPQSVCRMGACKSNIRIVSTPADTAIRQPNPSPQAAGPCAEASPPTPGELIINEILSHVPRGDLGDANGDGVRDPYDDEFIEIVNATKRPIDLTGVKIFGDSSLRFRFEPMCLPARQGVVVFGGGVTNLAPEISALASDSRLSLPNSGGEVVLVTPDEATVLAKAAFQSSDGVSWTRYPDIFGDRFVPHDTQGYALFSPGTCSNGRHFSDGCEHDEPEVEVRGTESEDVGHVDKNDMDAVDMGRAD